MADKPSYKAAHKERKGTATMEIEAAPQATPKEPYSEAHAAPLKKGEHPPIGISSTPLAGDYPVHADPGTVKKDEFNRPDYTGTTTT